MMPKPEEFFLDRFVAALSRPVQYRCAELTVLFDRASMKDLHSIFPLLLQNIFGHQGSTCWDLLAITNENNVQDFQALLHFLSPQGPLFKIIYMLLRDPMIKFDYGLNLLPEKLRLNLEQFKMHPFYADLIRIDAQRSVIICLSLNPFDYYMFNFAYHLIDLSYLRCRSISNSKTWGSLYYSLCCEYIVHFLPTSAGALVLPLLPAYNGKNPLYTLPIFKQQPTVASPINMPTLDHHPRNEIWRSETIMTVFIDMWLNSDQVVTSGYDFGGTFNMSTASPYKPKLNLNDMPTGEYIRIVRVLIKQLHAFASSAKSDDTHMRELKKIVLPYIQGKVYVFLRHLIHRWPLDGSFRLVLELWLSFIQPWRYPGNEYLTTGFVREALSDMEEINSTRLNAINIDGEYMRFMADNLLSYTVILQQILPRFTRVDLSSPKLALILFRLTKVFAQPKLVQYLKQIEISADAADISPVHCSNPNNTQNLPPLSPTSIWSLNVSQPDNYTTKENTSTCNKSCGTSGKWLGIVKQRILELEGTKFQYKPIFCSPPAPEVIELIHHIKQSEKIAQDILRRKIEEFKEQAKGIIGHLKSFFMIAEYSNDEFTMEERKRVPIYLKHSLQNLAEIFQIPDYVNINRPEDFSGTVNGTATTNDISALLTPRRVRDRVKNIKYEGDPDLHPIRSNENKLCVRLFYLLSTKINQRFQNEILNTYYKTNFVGKLARQVLYPPLTVYTYEKSDPRLSPRVAQHLPPRFSFREFASHKFIFYLVMVSLFSKLFSSSYLCLPLLACAVWAIYIFIKAILCSNASNLDDSNDTFMDASENFNVSDSF